MEARRVPVSSLSIRRLQSREVLILLEVGHDRLAADDNGAATASARKCCREVSVDRVFEHLAGRLASVRDSRRNAERIENLSCDLAARHARRIGDVPGL